MLVKFDPNQLTAILTTAAKTSQTNMQTKTALTNTARYEATRKVTITGAVINAFLAMAQLLGGIFAHSQALIADGIHTLSDLGSDFIVLLASKEAHKQADDEHPYGHGRIETIATSVLGALLLGVAVAIGIDTISRMFGEERLLQPEPMALFFAVIAVIAKEGLYHYTMRVAKEFNSSLLEANAWHHRSDAISSLFVIIGVGLSLAGFKYFDAIAALVVTLMVGRMGWKLVWQSGQELIDAALDEKLVAQIDTEIRGIDGVVNLHQLRTRQSGSDAFADVHIQVPSHISVSEGHRIADAVKHAVIDKFDQVTDVTVHTDPEDDHVAEPCSHLPLRNIAIRSLKETWNGLELTQAIEKVNLHYLDGQIEVDVYLQRSSADIDKAAMETFKSTTLNRKDVRSVNIFAPA